MDSFISDAYDQLERSSSLQNGVQVGSYRYRIIIHLLTLYFNFITVAALLSVYDILMTG